MSPRTILVLEDNDERIAAFQTAVESLAPPTRLRFWRDAPGFLAEAEGYFDSAAIISLDHDLIPVPGAKADPGTGLDVARFLADYLPVCPVLIHSSNTDRAWSMYNELRFAGWNAERLGPWIDTQWISGAWRRRVTELLSTNANTHQSRRPPDHPQRMENVSLSIAGVGLGDALGEMFASRAQSAPSHIEEDDLPAGPWFHTDDTEMAIAVGEVLRVYGFIEPDALARRFARRFERDPERGYGRMTRIQLREVISGADCRVTATAAFGGQGSLGNGAAMRATPIGAYFGDELQTVVEAARSSALVTHTHPDGVAGAIAVAIAAGVAKELNRAAENRGAFWDAILEFTPAGTVRNRILLASQTPLASPAIDVAHVLGNGSQVTALDTVPYALWCAARHANDFRRALAAAIQTGGDCDTNAAIVGGIVGLATGWEQIPTHWLEQREPTPFTPRRVAYS